MSIAADFQSWLTRGDALGCFQHRIAQARYARAWEYGDAALVLGELERVFAMVHKLPALNWLATPGTMTELDASEDGPQLFPEDWTEADFAVTLPDGQIVSAGWLASPGAWNELLARVLREFLFLPAGEKIETVKRWAADAAELSSRRPLGLSELALGWARTSLLVSASGQSDALATVLASAGAWMPAARDQLRSRADAVLASYGAVLGSPTILTFAGLRACKYVTQIDSYLAGRTRPAIANLMTYLRCQDAPATN
jgi:hypothetical protein